MKKIIFLFLLLLVSTPAYSLDLFSVGVGAMLASDGDKPSPKPVVVLSDIADGYLILNKWNFSHGKIITNERETPDGDRVRREYTFEEWVKFKNPQMKYVGFVLCDGETYLLMKKEK